MKYTVALCGLVLSAAVLAASAEAQTPNTTTATSAAHPQTNQVAQGHQWRASKMIGVDVYNRQDEKLGDIDEVLFDQSGKITGYVVGVGGFLGMGEHEVLIQPSQLTFVNEPRQARTASTAPTTDRTTSNRATTSGSAVNAPARAKDEKWYPDHAILDANKDQLKNMAQFKYD